MNVIDPSQRLVPSTAPEDHPIHGAAEAGDLARVCAFLDQEPSLVHDVNRAGGHPLHRAVIGGSAKVVMLLLDRSADIHAIPGVEVALIRQRPEVAPSVWTSPTSRSPAARCGCVRPIGTRSALAAEFRHVPVRDALTR